VHYRGGVSSAMTDVVMNMILAPVVKKQDQDFKKLYEDAKIELERLRKKKTALEN
jgi:transposase-like protein